MIPDLGKYSDTVLSAYAASILLLDCVLLVAFSVIRGRKVRAEMEKVEQRMSSTWLGVSPLMIAPPLIFRRFRGAGWDRYVPRRP